MNNWLLNLLLGILAILLGFFALANPIATTIATELFVAWAFIILGIVTVISAFTGDQTNGRIWTVLLGVLMVITGIALLNAPLVGVVALTWVVGAITLVFGVVKFFAGWKIRDTSLKWLTIISGVASFILGILIFNNPGWALGVLVAIELIFDGVALIAIAFSRKRGGMEA